MIFAGFVPLVFGVGVFTLIKKNIINRFAFYTYNSFIACLTVGMYMLGIFEIFGTTNHLINYYFYGALFFLIISIISTFIKKI